jgi:hypothetical protein
METPQFKKIHSQEIQNCSMSISKIATFCNKIVRTVYEALLTIFFYFAFVLMLLRYCFAYRNRKRRDIIIILKTVKFNFLMLTDTVVSRQTADVTLGGILQLYY